MLPLTVTNVPNKKTKVVKMATKQKKEKRDVVEGDLLKEWTTLYSDGDITEIAKKYELSFSTVATAFKGIATPTTTRFINRFYKSRKSKVAA